MMALELEQLYSLKVVPCAVNGAKILKPIRSNLRYYIYLSNVSAVGNA